MLTKRKSCFIIFNVRTGNMGNGYRSKESLSGSLLDIDLIECGKEQCVPQKHVVPMAKDCYTIHYVMNGSGFIKYNDVKEEVFAGDCFIIRPKMLVEYYPQDISPWCYSWIVFTGLYAEKIADEIFPDKGQILYKTGKDGKLEELFDKLVYAYFKEGKITLEAIGYTYLIFNRLSEILGEKNIKTKRINQQEIHIRETKDFINFNYMFDISVKDIANSQHVSPNYLCSVFRKQMGISPKQYITSVRMQRAKNILELYDFKVKDVALMVGYKDQLHFSHEFKKHFGVSPSNIKISGGKK